jgi:hypothetical protein
MSEFVVVAHGISMASLRSYLLAKKIDKGDSLVLNPADYETILDEIRNSDEGIDIPLNIFGVLLVKDTTDTVPAGKVQIIETEKL